jgi:hypothetical protein
MRPRAGPPLAPGPYDHRFNQIHWERESGYEFTQTHGPIKGTHPPHPTRLSGFMPEHYYPYESARDTARSSGCLLPINFPHFDGSHP